MNNFRDILHFLIIVATSAATIHSADRATSNASSSLPSEPMDNLVRFQRILCGLNSDCLYRMVHRGMMLPGAGLQESMLRLKAYTANVNGCNEQQLVRLKDILMTVYATLRYPRDVMEGYRQCNMSVNKDINRTYVGMEQLFASCAANSGMEMPDGHEHIFPTQYLAVPISQYGQFSPEYGIELAHRILFLHADGAQFMRENINFLYGSYVQNEPEDMAVIGYLRDKVLSAHHMGVDQIGKHTDVYGTLVADRAGRLLPQRQWHGDYLPVVSRALIHALATRNKMRQVTFQGCLYMPDTVGHLMKHIKQFSLIACTQNVVSDMLAVAARLSNDGSLNSLQRLSIKSITKDDAVISDSGICIPESLYAITHLHYLALAENNLYALSPSIGRLKNLVQLNLANNNLSELPQEVELLSCLRRLYLGGNMLEYLPEGIGRLTELRILSVPHNPLQKLPDNLAACTHLSELALRNADGSWTIESLQPALDTPCVRMAIKKAGCGATPPMIDALFQGDK
jgi:hypothetical protein